MHWLSLCAKPCLHSGIISRTLMCCHNFDGFQCCHLSAIAIHFFFNMWHKIKWCAKTCMENTHLQWVDQSIEGLVTQSQLNYGNFCYHLVQNLLSSHVLPRHRSNSTCCFIFVRNLVITVRRRTCISRVQLFELWHCSLVGGYQWFRETWYLHLQSMKYLCQPIRLHGVNNTKDHILSNQCHENLKTCSRAVWWGGWKMDKILKSFII